MDKYETGKIKPNHLLSCLISLGCISDTSHITVQPTLSPELFQQFLLFQQLQKNTQIELQQVKNPEVTSP